MIREPREGPKACTTNKLPGDPAAGPQAAQHLAKDGISLKITHLKFQWIIHEKACQSVLR